MGCGHGSPLIEVETKSLIIGAKGFLDDAIRISVIVLIDVDSPPGAIRSRRTPVRNIGLSAIISGRTDGDAVGIVSRRIAD